MQESSAKHRIAIPLSMIRKSKPKKVKKLSFSMFHLLVPMSLGRLSLQLGTLPCSWQISLGVDQLAERGPCVQFKLQQCPFWNVKTSIFETLQVACLAYQNPVMTHMHRASFMAENSSSTGDPLKNTRPLTVPCQPQTWMFCDHLNDIFHMEKGRDL